MHYSERLVKLYLPTLEMRRVMADLTTCYKLLNGFIDIDSDNFLLLLITLGLEEIVVSFKNHILNIRDANMFHNRVRQCCVSSVSYTHLTLPTKRIV